MSKHVLTTIAVLLLTSGAGLGQQPPPAATAPPARQAEGSQAAPSPRTPAQLVNIRLDLTISDQRPGAPMQSRVVTLMLADRENGRIRSGQGNAMLNVDARPEIARDGRIKAFLALEYRPAQEGDKTTTLLNQSLSIVLEDGRSLVVSQSADPTSDRAGVRVEVKATVVK